MTSRKAAILFGPPGTGKTFNTVNLALEILDQHALPYGKLFESYLGNRLRAALLPGSALQTQLRQHHLCSHEQKPWFELRPDFLISKGTQSWLLDAKWKLLDASADDGKNKYGISQGDFYQLFAYGERYLKGVGDMYLIFPQTEALPVALPVFDFSPGLRLWIVPFDLENGWFAECEALLQLPLRTLEKPSPIRMAA